MIKLSDSEWKIIDLLWEQGPLTIMQLTKILSEASGWTKSTVITLLKRMEEKDAVFHVEGDKAKLFYSKIDRSEAEIEETKTFLDKVYNGKIALMISNMIKQEALTEEDMRELQDLLKED